MKKNEDTNLVVVEGTGNEPAVCTPSDMLKLAVEKGADLATIEKFMDLQDRWEATNARKAFVEAMAKFRAECPTINKNKEVDFTSQKGRTNYVYADLAGTTEQIKELLTRCGLSYSWKTKQSDGAIEVICTVTHIQGHSESTSMFGPYDTSGHKNPIQAIGSATTFLQRYTLFSILGLAAAKDDDGQPAAQVECINDDQVIVLDDIIKERGINKAAVLTFYKIEALSEIPAKQFNNVKAALLQKGKSK